MMTVMLYGFLGQRFGRVHRYVVRSPGEAVRALCATLPGFRKALVEGGSYGVLRGGREALTLDQVAQPQSEHESVRIVPVVAGAGKGLGQILLGAALIFAAPYLTSLASGLGFAGVGAPTAFGVMVGSAASSIGWSLVIGGVSQMLFSPPKAQSVEAVSNQPSYAFNGPVNTIAQGNPVPVLYGRLIVGSQVISAGLSAEEIP